MNESNTPFITTEEADRYELDATPVQPANDYSIAEIATMVNNITTMNFIEANSFKASLEEELANLKSAKEMVTSIQAMESDELNKQLQLNNVGDSIDFKGDITKFLDEYDKNVEKLTTLIAATTARLAEYDGVNKNTTFLTNEMVDVLKRKLVTYSEAGIAPDSAAVAKIHETIAAFSTRSDYSFLMRKAELDYVIRGIYKDYKKDPARMKKDMAKNMLTLFRGNEMLGVEKFVYSVFDNDEIATHLFLIHLGKIVRNDANHSIYVKILVMNIMDTLTGIFDIDENGELLCTFLKSVKEKYKVY